MVHAALLHLMLVAVSTQITPTISLRHSAHTFPDDMPAVHPNSLGAVRRSDDEACPKQVEPGATVHLPFDQCRLVICPSVWPLDDG
jgi:hypothetical protein